MYGAGAIGGLVGGRLFEHGHDVVLIARGIHGRAIADRGLTIVSATGTSMVSAPVVEHPSAIEFRADDAVMLAMKSQDTASALDALVAAAPPTVAVVCLQNGVANERAAMRFFAQVYAVPVMCPATHLEPGIVEASSSPINGVFDIGRFPTGVDGTAVSLAGMLAASGFASMARPDAMAWKYSKLLMNLGNSIELMCGPAGRPSAIAEMAVDEGRAVLAIAGIALPDPEEEKVRRRPIQVVDIAGRRRGGGSTWQSAKRGLRTVETDFLNGEIVLLGRLHGHATPVNEFLQRRARQFASSGAEPGSLDVDALLDEL